MSASLANELLQLSATEKRELGEALIASAEADAHPLGLSAAQRDALRTRLAHHRAHPDEAGVSLQDLKAELLATRQ